MALSHPSWVRGLKQIWRKQNRHMIMSHPSWVRGLKRCGSMVIRLQNVVAPLVGAWIETITDMVIKVTIVLSHPSWVRGLKPKRNRIKNVSD